METTKIGDIKRINDDNLFSRELLNTLYVAEETKNSLILITADEVWSRIAQFGMRVTLDYPDMDERIAQILVFDLFRSSIAFAIAPMRLNASPSVISRLEEIVCLMDGYKQDLESGTMPEAKFIEENLWLSLEAVFLVMTDRMNHRLIPEERRELAEAVGALAFQKFRYSIYEKELAAVNECLEYQNKLDQKLAEQVNAYIDALNEELDEFDALVEVAFNTTDFQAAFRGSAELAKRLGAKEILRTRKDVDEYFLS